MKKLSYIFLMIATMAFVGCQKENVRVFDQTAAEGISGTYSGTWKLVDDKGAESEGQGTVVFSTVEGQANIVKMHMVCADIALDAATNANVAHAGDDYVYFNNNASALLPEDAAEDATVPAFQGRVHDNATTFSYTLKTGKGKKAKNNTYTFTGAR